MNLSLIKKLSIIVKLDVKMIDGLFCVGGWLRYVFIELDVKYLIILFKWYYVIELFIWEYYEKCGYFGFEYVLL